jgi:hypothetical protein
MLALSVQKPAPNKTPLPSQSSIISTEAHPTPPMGSTTDVTEIDSYPVVPTVIAPLVPTVIANQTPSKQPSQNTSQYEPNLPQYFPEPQTLIPSAPPPDYTPPSYEDVIANTAQLPSNLPNITSTEHARPIIPMVDRSSKPLPTPVTHTHITPSVNRDSKPTDMLYRQGSIFFIISCLQLLHIKFIVCNVSLLDLICLFTSRKSICETPF